MRFHGDTGGTRRPAGFDDPSLVRALPWDQRRLPIVILIAESALADASPRRSPVSGPVIALKGSSTPDRITGVMDRKAITVMAAVPRLWPFTCSVAPLMATVAIPALDVPGVYLNV